MIKDCNILKWDLSEPRQQRQLGLAQHMRFKPLYISYPSTAKQQREITKISMERKETVNTSTHSRNFK